MPSHAASAAHIHVPGSVIAGAILITVVLLVIRRLTRRVGVPVPPEPRYSFFWPVFTVLGIIAVAVAEDHHHTAAPVPPPAAAPPPPKVVIVHPPVSHPPLSGTQIVWIVAIFAVAVVAIRVNKIIHRAG
jgi:hypothetical protein